MFVAFFLTNGLLTLCCGEWLCLLQVNMKIRVIDVAVDEQVLIRVKSVYPITLEFKNGVLVAYEMKGGVFTQVSIDRPEPLQKAEEDAETECDEVDMEQETQPMEQEPCPAEGGYLEDCMINLDPDAGDTQLELYEETQTMID